MVEVWAQKIIAKSSRTQLEQNSMIDRPKQKMEPKQKKG